MKSYSIIFLGQVLNFHYSLLLVFVLKTCITRLQRTFLRHYLPFDDALRLHKVTAITAFLVSVIHVIAHSVNLGKTTSNQLRNWNS